jgi:hypothetical protein
MRTYPAFKVATASLIFLLCLVHPAAAQTLTFCARSGSSGGPVGVDDSLLFPSVTDFLPVLANDISPSGKALSVLSVSGVTGGTAAVTGGGGSVTFTPTAGATQGQFSYVLQDTSGITDTAVVTLSPRATIPPDPGRTLDFSATCTGIQCTFKSLPSDRNGILRYHWKFSDSGPTLTGGWSTAFHIYSSSCAPNVKCKKVTLELTYGDGQVLSKTSDIEVRTAAPTLTWAPRDGSFVTHGKDLNILVTENLFPQRPGQRTYSVDWGDGTIEPIQQEPIFVEQTGGHRFLQTGFFDVAVVVSETNAGSTTEYRFVKNVQIQNFKPEASMVVSRRASPNEWTYLFDLGATRDDSILATLDLHYGDGDHEHAVNPEFFPVLQHDYRLPGDYAARLTIVDNEGETSTKTVTVNVPNALPEADLEADCSVLTCNFSDFSMDREWHTEPADYPMSTSWDFGDGTVVDGDFTPSHTFTAPGCYPVRLRTTDSFGAIDELTRWMRVTDQAVTTRENAIVVDAHTRHANKSVQSNGNGILEPNEGGVVLSPVFRNLGASRSMNSTMELHSAPVGVPSWTIVYNTDPTIQYGTVASNALADCWTNTGSDCGGLAVNLHPGTPRPAADWDVVLRESEAGAADRFWTVHVGQSFTDVPTSHFAYAHAEALFHHGATSGCGGGKFCPDGGVTRESLAVQLILAMEARGYQPPACTTAPFNDVPCTRAGAPFIAQMKARGISAGCGSGNYCPDGLVTRRQVAAFLVAALGITPAACTTPIYGDVPCSDPLAPAINALTQQGIFAGCGGNNFCPTSNVTRSQLAIFLVAAFKREIAFRICASGTASNALTNVVPSEDAEGSGDGGSKSSPDNVLETPVNGAPRERQEVRP